MLELIESKLKDVVYADATDFIMKNDREHFDSVFTVIESFTINNDGIIGGNNGINILAGVPKSKDSYMYEIYIADVDKNARALADLLYNSEHKYVDKNTIRLETKLRNRIYELWIEARQIARIYSLVDYRGIKLFMLLNPVRAYGYFESGEKKQKVFCMSSEIQLLDIYRRLYNPYPSARGGINYETYDVLLSNEKKLYDVIAEDIINRAKGTKQDIMSVTRAEGGEKEIEEEIEKEIEKEIEEEIEKEIEKEIEEISGGSEYKAVPIIAKQLIKELSDLNKDTVIVGDYALYQILPNYPKEERLQILTTESMENIKNITAGILSSNKDLKNYVGVKVIGIRYPLNLPNDIMIEKFSLYLQNGDVQTFICDVFNSPSYEMIPFIGGSKIKYANLIVCLRFKFIDLYVSRLIHNLREGKDEFIVKKINQIAGSISMIRNKVTEMIESDPEKVFSTNSENYAGIFIMPNVILRTKIAEILKGKKYHYNYYPGMITS